MMLRLFWRKKARRWRDCVRYISKADAVVIIRFFRIPPSFGQPKDFFVKKIVLLLMTGIMFSKSVVASNWLATWGNHNGLLPNSSRSPTNELDFRTWNVTANFGSGVQVVNGDAWCGTSSTVAPGVHNISGIYCWCRMTSIQGHGTWSYNISDARGSGIRNCSGNRPSVVGPWTYVWSGVGCTSGCAQVCSYCVRGEATSVCPRAIILTVL